MGRKGRKKKNATGTTAIERDTPNTVHVPLTPEQQRRQQARIAANVLDRSDRLLSLGRYMGSLPEGSAQRNQIIDRQYQWFMRAVGNQSPRTRGIIQASGVIDKVRPYLQEQFDRCAIGGSMKGAGRHLFEGAISCIPATSTETPERG